MTVHDCDLCGSSDRISLPGDLSGKIGICKGCGFVYVAERRSVQEVAAAWDRIYASGGYDPNWPGVKARLFYVAEWLDQNLGLAGRSVLDIGAGNGRFLDYCRVRGAHVVGLDPSVDNVKKIKAQDIACFHGWAADESPDIGQYDIVTLNWTLENTGDCLEVLRYAKRQLAPNGHLVVATGSRIGVPFKKSLSSYLPQDPDYPHDTHCYRWSDISLMDALGACGLGHYITNDFRVRDEMIVSTRHEPVREPRKWGEPYAEIVANYFRHWQGIFP